MSEPMTPPEIKAAKIEDVVVIRDVLIERGESLALANAAFVLAIGLRNMPGAWTIAPEELAEFWALAIESGAGAEH